MTETERRHRENKLADSRFEREELGELLRLFSALGITVAAGIAGFFFIGVQADKWLAEAGRQSYGLGRIIGLLLGLGGTIYWAYLRIARHLRKFERRSEEK